MRERDWFLNIGASLVNLSGKSYAMAIWEPLRLRESDDDMGMRRTATSRTEDGLKVRNAWRDRGHSGLDN